ncbi:MBOAT family O-acyltransferase [Butyrivibrio sp. MC2021]|uniref:MBOAT family O-acyltransferase n=1 Tax=Butyrivibrio sp. MC2021 TaxID=1408306 RepID=UPI00047BA51F|nr:MBOAT family O-acyltransferase [Butyrivibrio sp. MC2021]
MGITSFKFLCFFALVLILYYLVPVFTKKKGQWVVLLAASVAYYLLSGNGALILYPVAASFVTWLLLRILSGTGEKELVKRRIILGTELTLLLGVLIILKYLKLTAGGSLLTPLGLSFYTFILLGYFIEVYNGIGKAQGSFLKTALYGMYFPLMISGPIMKTREDGEQFFEYHPLDYKNITFGMQRMLWGFFKELVISERLATVVNTIYGNDTQYQGAYIWLGTLCFAFQLYTNFSGCMDIVIGLSECFGIILPENFRTPFFAKNISEYWRRWHITLGSWMKDNVFYPLLRSKPITSLGKLLKNKIGKKKGKQYTTYVAMFILWFCVGMWHGGEFKYVIGSGLLHWTYIVIGELTLPLFTWLFADKMHIDLKSKFADRVRVVRTFFLVLIGDLFFRSDNVPHALRMLKESVSVFNPGILVDGSLLNLGLDIIEWGIVIVSMAILICVSVLNYRMEEAGEKKNVRMLIAERPVVIRWILYVGFLFYVILLAKYGPGYSAAEFIYKDF